MIAAECKNLRMQLEEVAKAEERERIVEQLEARRAELINLRDDVLTVSNSLKAVASRSKIMGKLDSTKCLERVQAIREALDSDPLSITRGRDFSNLKKAFEKFIEDGGAAAVETWELYLPKARPTVDRNQLAQAEQQDAFKNKTAQLRSRNAHAENVSRNPPATIAEMAALEALWDDIRRMIEELPAVSNDPLVQEFLKAANSRTGASLDLLTNEVRKWLQDNKLSDKYCIRTT